MKKIYLLLLVLVTLFVACNEDRDVEFATFTVVNEKITPSYTSVELSCQVDCKATINELYLQYDTIADFSTYGEVQLEFNKRKDVYSVSVEGLLDNTTYYVRYFAENSYSSAISDKVGKFKTLKPVKPTIEVKSVKALLDKTATVKIALKSNGGASILRMGVCWSTEEMPTIQDKYIEAKNNQLSIDLSELTPNTTYYVRAFAENKMGLAYSENQSFITLTLPEVKTGEIVDILSASAVVNGEALFDGNDITAIFGFCWSKDANPTLENQNIQVSKDTFSYNLFNLLAETKYYVRAYAKNKIGVVYGEEKEFVTKMAETPIVETGEVTDITCNSAKVGGNVMSDGGAEVTERGICYSLNNTPTIEDTKVVLGKGFGSFFTIISDLQRGMMYYVRAYAINKKGISYGESIRFTTEKYECVDLGLSVKWATCNVGATEPEEYGDYFAWGEIKPKEIYDWKSYKYGKDSESLTKYCNESSYGYNGFTDNKTVLDLSDDAAHVNWGGTWRMPTKEEMEELIYKCRWTWTTQNGVEGYEVTGPNENSIFLPAAGGMKSSGLYDVGSRGYYWSSSLASFYQYFANQVHFGSDDVDWGGNSRYYGLSVRPVCGGGTDDSTTKNKYTITVSANSSSYGTVSGGGMYEEGTQVTLTATPKVGYKFTEWHDGNTDNPRVITVTKDAIYTAHFEEEKNLNARHEYVDLGLPSGLKWATCNVGANVSEEYGDYFAWGEVEPKEKYDWKTYLYCKGTGRTMTKYCNNSEYGYNGFTDNKTVLDPEDDAATANWGGAWRMPTKVEQDELRNNCTWTWTTQNGIWGYKVIGPNGNSIFLPATGCMIGTSLYDVGSYGYYWSSSLSTSLPSNAYYAYFNSSSVYRSNLNRYYGRSVRPVCQ